MLKKLFLVLVSVGVAGVVSFFIAERFFFDKVMLGKSRLHGYNAPTPWILHRSENKSWIIGKRAADMHTLLDGGSNKDTQEKYRIALGDSFVYGLGVRQGERLSSSLRFLLPNPTHHAICITSMPRYS